LRSGGPPVSGTTFRELMVSPLFDSSDHFIDKGKYRKFFSGLINDAERIFRENLTSFKDRVDADLKPEFFDDVEPLDRPYFLMNLTAQVASSHESALVKDLTSRLGEAERTLRKKDEHLREI